MKHGLGSEYRDHVGHSRHLRMAVMKLKQGAVALPSALFAVSRVPFISAGIKESAAVK